MEYNLSSHLKFHSTKEHFAISTVGTNFIVYQIAPETTQRVNFQQSKQLAIQTFFSPYKTKNVLKENKQIWHKKYACSWTLSVPQISQFSLSLALAKLFLPNTKMVFHQI